MVYIKIKILSPLIIFILVFSSLTSVAFATDDIRGHYFENDMRSLIEKEIMVGYRDGSYKPNRHVTRAEFVTFLVRALEITATSETATFSDVEQGDWFFSGVSSATSMNLINGYPDGSFKPNEIISRQEMAAMTQRALDLIGVSASEAPLGFIDKPKINPIYYSAIQQLLYLDIMVGKVDNNGNNFFAPLDTTSRGEAAAILNRLLNISDIEKEVITTTHYNIDFNDMVAIQMTKTPKVDGAGIFLASESLVAYYANPNNFPKDSSDYLQFLLLSQPAGLNAHEINKKVLKGKGILEGQGQAFIDAGKEYNINEIYLIAHALHETGNGNSKLATGHLVSEVDGKRVTPKITYNMYGIRAYDNTPLKSGSEHAYKQGWFTPRKAIIGGAAFIAEGYINRGQDTLYKMRWNPSSPGYPQYATHVSWAVLQTNRILEIYNLIDSYVLKYDIPTFNNQPGTIVKPSGDAMYYVNRSQEGEKGKTNANLNLRTGPMTSFNIIKTLPYGTKVTIIGENGGWYKIHAAGTTGWVSAIYIQLDKDIQVNSRRFQTIEIDENKSDASQKKGKEIETIHEEESMPDTKEKETLIDQSFDQSMNKQLGEVTGDKVNVRTEASTSDPETIIMTLDKNTKVEIVNENAGWYLIIYEEQLAWIHGDYVELKQQHK